MTYTRTMTGSALPVHSKPEDIIEWAIRRREEIRKDGERFTAMSQALDEMKAEGGFEYGDTEETA